MEREGAAMAIWPSLRIPFREREGKNLEREGERPRSADRGLADTFRVRA